MNPSKFLAASEAARGWLNTVFNVVSYGKAHKTELAYQFLMPPAKGRLYNLLESYIEHADVLRESFPALAVLSDGQIEMPHGWGLSGVTRRKDNVYPHVWSSAHEAAERIADLALQFLVDPVSGITDPAKQRRTAERLLKRCCKALTLSESQVASWQSRIRREREKLLAAPSRSARTTPTKVLPTIWHHGDRSYSTDRTNPIKVTREMDNVLGRFLNLDKALDTNDLSTAVANVAVVIRKLEKQFGKKAIRRPFPKGTGYFIRVRSALPIE